MPENTDLSKSFKEVRMERHKHIICSKGNTASMVHSLMQLIVNETKMPSGLSESSMGYIWCFLTFSEHGIELTNHYMNADTNRT